MTGSDRAGRDHLADRLRAALSGVDDVREVAMFGGVSFMVDDRLILAARSGGELLVRVDAGRVEDLVSGTRAEWAEMRGRRMGRGWLVITADAVRSPEELHRWVDVALADVPGGSAPERAG